MISPRLFSENQGRSPGSIYATNTPIALKARMGLASGLFGGLFLGLSLALALQLWINLKADVQDQGLGHDDASSWVNDGGGSVISGLGQ